MEASRRSVLKAFGAIPLLFSPRLLGEGPEWVKPEKPDEPIRVMLDGYVRSTFYPVPMQRYLSGPAKKLYNKSVNSTIIEYLDKGRHQKAPVMFMAKEVDITPSGPSVEVVKKWAAMLNKLATEKIWIKGTLMRAYYTPLEAPFMPNDRFENPYPMSEAHTFRLMCEAMECAKAPPTKAALITYVVVDPKYADDWSGSWLNAHLGAEVFAGEGSMCSGDFTGFPDLRA